VLESENAPVSEIKAKLKELREARKAAETALRDAREKLRSVLGHRQEAQLVLLGLLD
jgi:outer membrane protein TolC